MDQKAKKQNTAKNYKYNSPLDQSKPKPLLDRLSSLPEVIIVDILSILPTNIAVSTSLLSHRWRFLWTKVTSLRLDCCDFSRQSDVFYTAVDQLLTRLTSPFIRTFSINVPYPRQHHFEPWLRQLCTLKVRKIHISVEDRDDDSTSSSPFTVPHCLFQTLSLVELILQPRDLDYSLPNDTNVIIKLPNLKILNLQLRAAHCGFVTKLVGSCPLLQDLSLTAAECWRSDAQNYDPIIDISCRNLKKLNLELYLAEGNVKVVIDAPNSLASIFLGSNRFICCSFVNKPIALRKVMINTVNQALMESLIPVISNAVELHVRTAVFGMLESFKDDQGNALILCRKLTKLRLCSWSRLVDNIDRLDYFPFELTSPRLLLYVRRISVGSNHVRHRKDLMKLAEYLLINAPALEILDFVVDTYYAIEEVENFKLEELLFCIDLYSFSKSSPQCAIIFRGQFVELPTDVEELREMENQAKKLKYQLSELSSVDCEIRSV